MNTNAVLPYVYSADEIARVAGVRAGDVRGLAESGTIHPLPGGRYFSMTEAVVAVHALAGAAPVVERPLFRPPARLRRKPGMPLALAGTLHAAILALIVFVTSMGVATTQARVPEDLKNLRLVFLILSLIHI